MNNLWKSVAVLIAAAALLGGCAVYEPAPQTYAQPVYREAPRTYVEPAPVYVQPAPVYVGPPVTFGFNFGWWGGHHGHRRW